MATVLLVRHGRTTANDKGVLAGRTPGVLLDETGERQAAQVAERIAPLPVCAVVTSPLERCRQTAEAVASRLGRPVEVEADAGLIECGYGTWTGGELKKLAKDKLWRAVQAHPSGVTFPDGESMRDMQVRAVRSIRDVDTRLTGEHGAHALWVAVSHGDVIKSVLADALGLHLDQFQRLVVDPASVSVVSYTPLRPFVVRMNDLGDLTGLAPRGRKRRSRAASSDAKVGGGAGG